MIEAGGVLLEYRPVLGVYKPGMHRAEMHAHIDGDTATTPEKTLFVANRKGFRTIIVTDHDRNRTLDRCREVNEKHGLGLDVLPGVESTAVVEHKKGGKRGKPRHVLVYDTEEAPPCYMPVDQLNRWVHERGGFTSAAHPGLGSFSMTHEEMRRVQDHSDEESHLDFAEVHNGAIPLLMRFAANHPRATRMLVRSGLMPQPSDTNETTQSFLETMKHKLNLKGVTAGTDDHDGNHVGEVALAYDPDLGLFGSIQSGDFAVLQQRVLAPIAYLKNIPETIRSWKLEFDRRRGRNGIVLYVPNAAREESAARELVVV